MLGIAGAISAMLLLCRDNRIELFGSWPENKDAEFTDFCAEGAFLVSAAKRSGRVAFVNIKAQVNGKCRILNPWKSGKILFNGTKVGYVSTQYLSMGYSAISLNVPSFKQTDSRWANIKIANSGKTIAQIGCATTGIAMIESYRTGTTIYPDAMSKKLSYSSTGNVYWPSHYSVVTSSSNYLNGIYNQLKNGKPVLLGAKKYSGAQHWVVITGFTGGDTLSATNFTINDPGSSTRKTLQQFLNEYPVFYKYFYY